MDNKRNWSCLTGLDQELKDFVELGMTTKEISILLGLTQATVSIYCNRKLGLKNPNYLKRITKHKHLHKKALKTFLTNSHKETASILGLSEGELKSCLTYAYKDENLKSIRKDKRKKDKWSSRDLRILLTNAGLISRKEICEKLNRGKTVHVVKDKLGQLGVSSKNLNGLTITQFRNLFKKEARAYKKTSAGSGGDTLGGHFKIVPWTLIEKEFECGYIDHSAEVELYVKSMALFQRWTTGNKKQERSIK